MEARIKITIVWDVMLSEDTEDGDKHVSPKFCYLSIKLLVHAVTF
jgi:hypothetical protein